MKVTEEYNAKKEVLVKMKLLMQHENKTIIICNRVEKAQQLYNDYIPDRVSTPDRDR